MSHENPRPDNTDPRFETESQKRRCGRVLCQHIVSSLGDVQDLSASGVRIRTRGRPIWAIGQGVTICIQDLDVPLTVVGEVMWVRKTGWWSHEVGVQFVNVTDEQRVVLNRLARASVQNETIRPDIERFRRSA